MKSAALDLVLVNPSSRRGAYQSLGATLTAVENPVRAGLIATFVRRRGFSVQIVDAEADKLLPEQTVDVVSSMKPRLVAVVVYGHHPSASTQNMAGASAILTALKAIDPEITVMMLGGHVAALPERTLVEEACDFVARDEGLFAVIDLLTAMHETGDPDVSAVRGLGYRVGSVPAFAKGYGGKALAERRVALNPAAPLVTDLDREIPGIAWDLLPMPRYHAHNWHCFGDLPRQPYAALFGLPEDTAETMGETLDLALDLNCEFANFYSAMAYPGSLLYDEAQRRGWRLPDTSSGYSQHAVDTLPLPTRHISAADVLRFRDEAFHTYFTNPRYLDLVRRKFGDRTVADVHEMTAHRLERQFAPA